MRQADKKRDGRSNRTDEKSIADTDLQASLEAFINRAVSYTHLTLPTILLV